MKNRTLALLVAGITLALAGTVLAQEPDIPVIPFNQRVNGLESEAHIYRVPLATGQTVLLAAEIFDACLEITGPNGEVLITDNDVAEYVDAALLPFTAPETGDYLLRVGRALRCDPMGDDTQYYVAVLDRDWPTLGPTPLTVNVWHPETTLLLADLTAGSRYRLTMTVDEDLPAYRTLYTRVLQRPLALDGEMLLPLTGAQQGEYTFEAEVSSTVMFTVVYRKPNPSDTDDLEPVAVTLTLEELSE